MNCPQCGSQLVEYEARPERGEPARLECRYHWLIRYVPGWCPQEPLPVPVHVVLEREGHPRLPGM